MKPDWQPYADKVIAALEQYTPEAWRAMVEYKGTEATIGAVACLGSGVLFAVTFAVCIRIALKLYNIDARTNWEVFMAAATIAGTLAICLIPIGVKFLPTAINPEGAVLLQVLGGAR